MKMKMLWAILPVLLGCSTGREEIGRVEKWNDSLDAIMAAPTQAEVLASGYVWSEGPLWLPRQRKLIFSDVPANVIYAWSENEGASLYMANSGFAGTGDSREPGSNGLLLDASGQLVLCQHGNRALARMNRPLEAPEPVFEMLALQFEGKRLNSPNDAVMDAAGNFYFTDPPYGLAGQDEDPAKELSFNGVFRRNTDGSVELLIDSLTRPNGIALSPDERFLLVANSDPNRARWYRYTLEGGQVTDGKVLVEATSYAAREKGLPDGLKVDARGTVYATGPGGVWIFDLEGSVAGRFLLPEATSNCALDTEARWLYVTNHMHVVRIPLLPR